MGNLASCVGSRTPTAQRGMGGGKLFILWRLSPESMLEKRGGRFFAVAKGSE